MNHLSSGARALIDKVGVADGPSVEDRQRIRASLFGTLATTAVVTGSTGAAFGAQVGSGSAGAALTAEVGAGAGLAALTGKGTAAVVLWFVAGGAAGATIATPVALYSERPQPVLLAPPTSERENVERATDRRPAARVAANEASRPVVAEVPSEDSVSRRAMALPEASRSSSEMPNTRLTPSRAPDSVRENAAALPQLASEVALLKSAQRELASANAAQSLALLEQHARRYPEGALKAERLGARVFALCKLGQVEQARSTAREFLSIAGSSPLVPRVLASCAGSGANAPSNDDPGTKR